MITATDFICEHFGPGGYTPQAVHTAYQNIIAYSSPDYWLNKDIELGRVEADRRASLFFDLIKIMDTNRPDFAKWLERYNYYLQTGLVRK